ncbi:MAG: diaminopimelate epimerase [Lachnospiraceae bacterium]|nr:diaminopimelate epimerase [Lachnospiraceae bacterium]
MKFTKMQGCGNDYIYFNCFEETIRDPESLSIRLSDRHTGIGGDGIVLIKPSDKADFFMDMYNNDGSRGKMCGNAIRCVGKYVYEHGMTDKAELEIETLSGIKRLKLKLNETDPKDRAATESNTSSDSTITESIPAAPKDKCCRKGIVTGATVDMGAPITDVDKIPLNTEIIKENKLGYTLAVLARCHRFTFVSMGNPHAVTFVDNVDEVPLEELGPAYEHHEIFPERANIEFVHVIDRTHIEFRVWERGSGETMACGTGACASAYACILNGFTENEVNVKMRGGSLVIKYDPELDTIFMTGPAVEVFTGEIE